VDAYGRGYFPDAPRSAVQVLDANGNPVHRFGRWGNLDDDYLTPGDPAQPALAWPVMVSVRDRGLFIADRLNKRVVKMTLGARAEAEVGLAVP
jgi:hypothetical protein